MLIGAFCCGHVWPITSSCQKSSRNHLRVLEEVGHLDCESESLSENTTRRPAAVTPKLSLVCTKNMSEKRGSLVRQVLYHRLPFALPLLKQKSYSRLAQKYQITKQAQDSTAAFFHRSPCQECDQKLEICSSHSLECP